eukprot:COSAG04_NODE_2034_length_4964_cov_5.911202_1_plen_219_part_00
MTPLRPAASANAVSTAARAIVKVPNHAARAQILDDAPLAGPWACSSRSRCSDAAAVPAAGCDDARTPLELSLRHSLPSRSSGAWRSRRRRRASAPPRSTATCLAACVPGKGPTSRPQRESWRRRCGVSSSVSAGISRRSRCRRRACDRSRPPDARPPARAATPSGAPPQSPTARPYRRLGSPDDVAPLRAPEPQRHPLPMAPPPHLGSSSLTPRSSAA